MWKALLANLRLIFSYLLGDKEAGKDRFNPEGDDFVNRLIHIREQNFIERELTGGRRERQ